MMDILEARRLSAEFCGKTLAYTDLPEAVTGPYVWVESDGEPEEWTPDTNAEQMAECMEAVVNAGWYLHYHGYGCSVAKRGSFDTPIVIEAPLRECAMYAAAELKRRN